MVDNCDWNDDGNVNGTDDYNVIDNDDDESVTGIMMMKISEVMMMIRMILMVTCISNNPSIIA